MAIALPLPNLDDRRWVDLVDEGRALVPFYAPNWTDHNASDPGITFIELFAWLAEMDLYSVNRITDAMRRKFLTLAGVASAPPRAAETMLQLLLASGATAPTLPAGIEFAGRDPFGSEIRFRSRHTLTARPGGIAAVATTTGATRRDLTASWDAGEAIAPFGTDPEVGSAFWVGLDIRPVAWDDVTFLSLGCIVADPARELSRDERARLHDEIASAATDCTPPWTTTPCGCNGCGGLDHSNAGPADAGPTDGHQLDPDVPDPDHHDVRLVWEVATGPGHWRQLTSGDEIIDGTRALTLDGRVVVSLAGAVPVTLAGANDARVWLRARIARGRYDAPPILRGFMFNAVEVVQSVPAVTDVPIAAGTEIGALPAPHTPAAFDLGLDAAGAIERLTFATVPSGPPAVRVLGKNDDGSALLIEAAAAIRGTGAPTQTIEIDGAPVVSGSVRVATDEVRRASDDAGEWRAWSARPDFDASRRADAHFVADSSAGTIVLGDGEHSRTARAGSAIVVVADLTAASAGNLAATTIDAVADSRHNRAAISNLTEITAALDTISNPVGATGGAPAESLDATIARARDERERAARAVTLDDHVALAMATPGVRLARAEARANFHPGFPCLTAPGVVTVLVLPFLPADRPVPTAGLRYAVATYLERRRIIGCRVEVAGPVYVTVTVRASIEAVAGARPADVQAAISRALDAFFHPLHGGPDGTGWPFGRDVYRSEVLQVIDDVPGVAHVVTLDLAEEGSGPTCGNVCIGPAGLVDAGTYEIDVR